MNTLEVTEILSLALAVGVIISVIPGIILPNLLMYIQIINLETNLTLQEIIVPVMTFIIAFLIFWKKTHVPGTVSA